VTDYTFFVDVQKNMNTDLEEDAFKERVRDLIREVSVLVETRCDRRFDHRIETLYHNSRHIDRGGDVTNDGLTLMLKDDLQEVTQVMGNGSLVDPTYYGVMPSSKTVAHPFHYGAEMVVANSYWSSYIGTPASRSLAVTGIWGWGGTWKRHSTVATEIADDGVFLDLSSYAKLDYGKILRIGTEYLEIDDEGLPDPAPSGVSVVRGVNGSTPAVHLETTPVYVFVPHPLVTRLVKRLVLWQSALDDSPLFGSVTLGDQTTPVDLSAAPKDVKDLLILLERKN
jgi:hypothetical protein